MTLNNNANAYRGPGNDMNSTGYKEFMAVCTGRVSCGHFGQIPEYDR